MKLAGGGRSNLDNPIHPSTLTTPGSPDFDSSVEPLIFEMNLPEVLRQRFKALNSLDVRELDIWTGTFNINGKAPTFDQDLVSWLHDHFKTSVATPRTSNPISFSLSLSPKLSLVFSLGVMSRTSFSY